MTQRFSDRDEYTRAKLNGNEEEIVQRDINDPDVNVPDDNGSAPEHQPMENDELRDADEEREYDPYKGENQFTQNSGRDVRYGHEGSRPGSDRNRYGTKGSQDQYGDQQ